MKNTKEIRRDLRNQAQKIIGQMRTETTASLIYKLGSVRTSHSKLTEIRRKNASAVKRWREANPKHYQDYQRDYFQRIGKSKREIARDSHPSSC